MNRYPLPSSTPPRRAKPLRWLGLFIVAGVAALVVHSAVPHHSSADAKPADKPAIVAISATAIQAMGSQINQLISAQSTVDTTVTIIDLQTAKSYNYGPAVPYEAASIGKLITAADYLHSTETGTQSLDTTLETGNSAAVDLQKMIVNSDNTSWQSLNDQLGTTSLADYATSIGITDYDLDNNTLTTPDIAGLLQKLYTGSLLNASDRQLLLGYMKIANEADFIPPVVPAGVAVYHKAGLLDDRIHDAAIIDNGVHPIVIVIFTNGHGTYDTPARTTLIQSITQAALTAFDIH